MLESLLKIIFELVEKLLGDKQEPTKKPKKKKIKIKKNTKIAKMYNEGFKRKKPIEEIVIHGTAGGSSVEGLVKWMESGERAKEYKKGIGTFHYAIGRDGIIINIIKPDKWVYHSSSGWHDKVTLGIELLNPSKTNRQPYTNEQYAALYKLIEYLMNEYIGIHTIVSHKYNKEKYSKKTKQCPGMGFDWKKIKEKFGKNLVINK